MLGLAAVLGGFVLLAQRVRVRRLQRARIVARLDALTGRGNPAPRTRDAPGGLLHGTSVRDRGESPDGPAGGPTCEERLDARGIGPLFSRTAHAE